MTVKLATDGLLADELVSTMTDENAADGLVTENLVAHEVPAAGELTGEILFVDLKIGLGIRGTKSFPWILFHLNCLRRPRCMCFK